VGKDAAETVNTKEPNTAPQRWEQPPTRDETDPMIEAMPVTQTYVDGQDNVHNRVHSREQTVDDATVIVREEVQTAKSQQIHGNIQLPSKRRNRGR
jgi:hypothetical protein